MGVPSLIGAMENEGMDICPNPLCKWGETGLGHSPEERGKNNKIGNRLDGRTVTLKKMYTKEKIERTEIGKNTSKARPMSRMSEKLI